MSEFIEVTLEGSIDDCLAKLRQTEPGTEEYKAVSCDLERLYKLQNDENKIKNTFDADMERLQVETKLKKKQQELEAREIELKEAELEQRRIEAEQAAKDAKKGRIVENIKTGATIFGTTAGVGSTVYLALKTMKFEETGSIRSKAWPKIHNLFKH